jgi:geranylgeranyl reductase
MTEHTYDCIVVGGGPAGATAAADLARAGRDVLLLDRMGRIKPCGGAVPPRLLADFAVPEDLLVARATQARMIAPSNHAVDMEVGGWVGMVDREVFDEWLRARAEALGAERRTGTFTGLERDPDGTAVVVAKGKRGEPDLRLRARAVIGADGARSGVARAVIAGSERNPCVFAYHEVIRSPETASDAYQPERCDVFYQGRFSPDFYGWVFPHGAHASIGVGSANKGYELRDAVKRMRDATGLAECETVRCEGAPIPLKPLPRWDNGRDVVLCGDAAGVVAPASGEGIYYAMACARHAAEGVHLFLSTGDARALSRVRKRFLGEHGRVFWILGMMQKFWYSSDKRRERFVAICADKDVQELTWQAYMHKKLVKAKPLAHVRIFLKDMGHLLGLAPVHG